jgi:hypothetical protein
MDSFCQGDRKQNGKISKVNAMYMWPPRRARQRSRFNLVRLTVRETKRIIMPQQDRHWKQAVTFQVS